MESYHIIKYPDSNIFIDKDKCLKAHIVPDNNKDYGGKEGELSESVMLVPIDIYDKYIEDRYWNS